MGKLFGTDGVRGVAGKDLTCELALQIGRATAAELTSLDGHRPRILIGKDTRVSGDMLECTLAAGLCSVGADVDLLGVIPTPGVAYLVRKYGADAGIVISASHNPMEFNGIKIFKGDGYKLPDEVENRIEAHIFKNCEDIKICDGAEIGRVHRLDTAVDDYVDALEQHIDADLSGLNVLFDCANGASAKVAQKLFPRLGCQCSFTGTLDDGVSVNDGCGSTHLDRLGKKAYPVLCSSPEKAIATADGYIAAGHVPDIVFFDLPGTVNSEGVINSLAGMDYIFTPISADKVVLESSLSFAMAIQKLLVRNEACRLAGLYLFWNMVDGREKSELYKVYEQVIGELGLKVLNTFLPDSKRFRRELTGEHKALFRSTLFPADSTLVKGSNLKEITEELLSIIKK